MLALETEINPARLMHEMPTRFSNGDPVIILCKPIILVPQQAHSSISSGVHDIGTLLSFRHTFHLFLDTVEHNNVGSA